MTNLPTLTTKLEQSALTKLNVEEKKIVLASYGVKMFKDYEQNDKQELAKLLVRLSYFVGIKEPLSIEALKMLVKFLVSEFPTLNSQELEQGFYFCCSGKLGSFEHFQNFSPLYMGKIINAYQTHTAQIKIKYRRLLEQEQNELKAKAEMETYDILEGAITTLTAEYDNFKKTGHYDNQNENYSSYVEVMAQTCVMLLNKSLRFFEDKKVGKDSMETLTNYFVSLPKDRNQAIDQIKSDCNVCYQRCSTHAE
jgi:hypothetical protein